MMSACYCCTMYVHNNPCCISSNLETKLTDEESKSKDLQGRLAEIFETNPHVAAQFRSIFQFSRKAQFRPYDYYLSEPYGSAGPKSLDPHYCDNPPFDCMTFVSINILERETSTVYFSQRLGVKPLVYKFIYIYYNRQQRGIPGDSQNLGPGQLPDVNPAAVQVVKKDTLGTFIQPRRSFFVTRFCQSDNIAYGITPVKIRMSAKSVLKRRNFLGLWIL